MNIERKEYASKGVAGSGLGLGIAGTALGLLNGGGGLAALFGGGGCGGNPHNAPVNRYEAELQGRIAALEADVKLRDANTYTMQEMGKFRDYVDAKFDKIADRTDARFAGVDARLCAQTEWNAAQTGAIACMKSQIAQLFGLTKLVVPNTSVCPGWGDVTITPATAAAAA